MSTNIKDLENRLWEAADHMRANSSLRLNEFAEPVLGLIFLKFAGVKFSKTEKEIAEERKVKTKSHGGASVARERRFLPLITTRKVLCSFLKRPDFHTLSNYRRVPIWVKP